MKRHFSGVLYSPPAPAQHPGPPPSFSPTSALCVEGPFFSPGRSLCSVWAFNMHFAFCQGGQEGTWRSQMAYLFPQETRRDSAGHLPSSRQGERPPFQEELVPVPVPERTALSPACLLHCRGARGGSCLKQHFRRD